MQEEWCITGVVLQPFFFLQLGGLCPDRDPDLRKLHLGPCLNLLGLCVMFPVKEMGGRDANYHLERWLREPLGTAGRRALPWVLRAEGFHKQRPGMISGRGAGVVEEN